MSDLPVTIADGAVVIVLLLSALLAFARGFVNEVLSVGAWVGAIAAVVFVLPLTRPVARSLIEQPLFADIAAGAVIFIVALIALSLLTGHIGRAVRASTLNAVDRSLGVVFGLARGALIVCLGYIAIAWLIPPPEQPAWLRQAKSMPLVEAGADWLKSLVPAGHGVQTRADPAVDHLRKVLETERLAREIMSPEPKSPARPEPRNGAGYADRDRQDLERLLDGNAEGSRTGR